MFEFFLPTVHPFYFWFVIFFCSTIIELIAPGFFYFLSGAVSALIVAPTTLLCNISPTAQLTIFLIFSFIIFFILKKFAEKKLPHNKEYYHGHLEKLIKEEGTVITLISEGMPGQVRIKNEVWLAYSINKKEISVGKKVVIVSAQGAHLIVRALE